jgi:hypothetical protein
MKSRPQILWRDLPPETQTQLAHIVAVLVRRLHRQRQTEGPCVEHA